MPPFPSTWRRFGYMWFSIGDMNLETRLNGVRVAAPQLNAFLDAELARHKLSDADLLLMGFSQGAMMALHVGLRRARPPAGIIAHSGMLVADHRFATEIRSRPPVLLTHGSDDQVLPAACLPAAETVLKMAGVPVELHLMPNLGHGIDEATLRLDLAFLRARFPAARLRAGTAPSIRPSGVTKPSRTESLENRTPMLYAARARTGERASSWALTTTQPLCSMPTFAP